MYIYIVYIYITYTIYIYTYGVSFYMYIYIVYIHTHIYIYITYTIYICIFYVPSAMVIFDEDSERCNSGITRNNTVYIYRERESCSGRSPLSRCVA